LQYLYICFIVNCQVMMADMSPAQTRVAHGLRPPPNFCRSP